MHSPSAALSGLAAVAAAVVATELVVLALGGDRLVTAAVADAVISNTPGAVATFAVTAFRGASRMVLAGSMTLVVAGLAALIGVAAQRRHLAGHLGLVLLGAFGAAVALADPFVPGVTAVLAPLLGAAAGSAVLVLRLTAPRAGAGEAPAEASTATSDAPPHPAPHPPGGGEPTVQPPGQDPHTRARDDAAVWRERDLLRRRRFLALSLTTAAGALTLVVAGRAARGWLFPGPVDVTIPAPPEPLAAPAPATMLDVEGITPLITPLQDFYRIDTAAIPPRIDPESYVIQVIGMVDEPLTIGYAELLELADTEADVTLTCVSNEVGGGLVGNARWFGVPLDRLLDRAGVQEGVDQIVGRAVDGWTAGFPLEAAYDGRPALVAIGMNGDALPRRHGFPARLVVAGLYGYVSDTKWLSQIELTTFDAYDAYWVTRGWDRFGPVRTQTRIDVPSGRAVRAGATPIAGVAWAGERGISGVEVSIDGGAWQRAELAAALAETTWRQWRLNWDATPGRHLLRARAIDGNGEVQTAEERPPEPSGATGYHEIPVEVS